MAMMDKKCITVLRGCRCRSLTKENKEMKYSKRLKPCPFCGGKGEVYQAPTMLNLKIDDDVYWVQCRNCFSRVGNSYSKVEAINAWNRRTDNEKMVGGTTER